MNPQNKPLTKRAIGNHFEDRAVEYLQSKHYEIVARNVIYRFGEIDIVAHQGETLVFVEVRKRSPKHGIAPQETVTYPKQLRLLNSIQAYVARYRGRAKSVRIDLIGFMDEDLVHFEDFMRM